MMFKTSKQDNVRMTSLETSFNWDETLVPSRFQAYLYKEFKDVNLKHDYIPLMGDELVGQIVLFFIEGSQLVYPAKSYFVAIVYASLICFWSVGDDFFSILGKKDLLPDDKYFTPYGVSKEVDEVYKRATSTLVQYMIMNGYRTITYLNRPEGEIWRYFKSTEATVDYFLEEFLFSKEDIMNVKKSVLYNKQEG